MEDNVMPVSEGILSGLAQGANPTAQAFGARTQQLDQKREQEQAAQMAAEKQRDADMHTVFKYAGDGLIEEAKYFAQQKGIQVPEQVYSNATFAKGLDMAGSIYGDDPERAQIFTEAFMRSEGDLQSKFAAGIQVAGKPMSASDRDFQNFIRKEQWKLRNGGGGGGGKPPAPFNLSPGQARYDGNGRLIVQAPPAEGANEEYQAYQKAYNAAISSGLKTQEEADQAGQMAAQQYRAFNAQRTATAGGQSGLTSPPPSGSPLMTQGQQPAPTAAPVVAPVAPEMQVQKAVHAVQQLMMKGYTPQQIEANLVQRGATPEQVQALLKQAAGAQ